MKKWKNRAVLIGGGIFALIRFSIGALLGILICRFVYCEVTAAYADYKRKANAKEFVEYLTEHIDEVSRDFEGSGLVFSMAEQEDMPSGADVTNMLIKTDADMLIVTDADGWRFCYQTIGKYGDELVMVKGHIDRVQGSELITGSLEIMELERTSHALACVRILEYDNKLRDCVDYTIPEFDSNTALFRPQVDEAHDISQWISAEELSALYKSGKELEEILSGYCSLKRNNADVAIQYTPLYRKATP